MDGLVIFALCAVVASASPLPTEPRSAYIDTQQFLVLHPQVAAPHLSPLKYEQPIIAPITQLGHISTPKEQLYFFYPSSPLSDAPIVQFQRDDGGDFNLISFISNWFASKPQETTAPAADSSAAQPTVELQPVASPEPAQSAAEATQSAAAPSESNIGEELRPVALDEQTKKTEKIEINPDAELIPQVPQQPAAAQPQPQPIPRPPQPAFAPFPLVPQLPDRRVYIVSGQPQFFGNFDAFANPLNPIFSLQPLTPIIPRNKEGTSIEAVSKEETTNADGNTASDLKSSPEVSAEEPAVIVGADGVLGDPNPTEDAFARGNSRIEFLNNENNGDVQLKQLTDVEKRITQTIQENAGATPELKYNEPSVAQAAPSGLAIAGVGGVASSQPQATAVSGDGGISLASPKATSIAGNFFDFDEKKKLKLGGSSDN